MTIFAAVQCKSSLGQTALASEGIAAAQFARCGFDVSVQYGADKPIYDLVVAKAGILLKVSVKGSQDGGWDLTQSYLKRAREMSGKKADFHGAIDLWQDHHGSRTVCCLVQFQGVAVDQLPRIYLASPRQIAQRLRDTDRGRGDSILYEECEWISPADGTGVTERLPQSWRFSKQRIEELVADHETGVIMKPLFSVPRTSSNLARETLGALQLSA
jgi:hypothetical protein